MRIVPPQTWVSAQDKEILGLMSRLLLEQIDPLNTGANLPPDTVALSDAEASRLLALLNSLVEHRNFVESAFLIEELSSGAERNDRAIREIYLKNRASRGRTRIMASTKWADYLSRLGVRSSWHPYIGGVPMSDTQFIEMERRLFASLDISQPVSELLLKYVRAVLPKVRTALSGQRKIPSGTIRSAIIEPFRDVARQRRGIDRTVSSTKVVAAMTLVADLSILFTTRDWDVAGTLSGMSGAFIALALPEGR